MKIIFDPISVPDPHNIKKNYKKLRCLNSVKSKIMSYDLLCTDIVNRGDEMIIIKDKDLLSRPLDIYSSYLGELMINRECLDVYGESGINLIIDYLIKEDIEINKEYIDIRELNESLVFKNLSSNYIYNKSKKYTLIRIENIRRINKALIESTKVSDWYFIVNIFNYSYLIKIESSTMSIEIKSYDYNLINRLNPEFLAAKAYDLLISKENLIWM